MSVGSCLSAVLMHIHPCALTLGLNTGEYIPLWLCYCWGPRLPAVRECQDSYLSNPSHLTTTHYAGEFLIISLLKRINSNMFQCIIPWEDLNVHLGVVLASEKKVLMTCASLQNHFTSHCLFNSISDLFRPLSVMSIQWRVTTTDGPRWVLPRKGNTGHYVNLNMHNSQFLFQPRSVVPWLSSVISENLDSLSENLLVLSWSGL